jgi:hypothetical protein
MEQSPVVPEFAAFVPARANSLLVPRVAELIRRLDEKSFCAEPADGSRDILRRALCAGAHTSAFGAE